MESGGRTGTQVIIWSAIGIHVCAGQSFHTLRLFLFYLVDAAPDDTEWGEFIEIKLMPRPTEGINKQRIRVRFP